MNASANDAYDTSAAALREGAAKLLEMLRIRTLPIGIKLFADAEEMLTIKGIRT